MQTLKKRPREKNKERKIQSQQEIARKLEQLKMTNELVEKNQIETGIKKMISPEEIREAEQELEERK